MIWLLREKRVHSPERGLWKEEGAGVRDIGDFMCEERGDRGEQDCMREEEESGRWESDCDFSNY